MSRVVSLAMAVLIAIGVAAPAHAQKVFSGMEPTIFLKRWSPNEWHVWAMRGGICFALSQEPEVVPFKFWGFRQRPGSRVELLFGGIDSAKPRTLQMSFNNGGKFDYDAKVEHATDWDAYVISLQSNALSVFHDQTIVEAYVHGTRVFAGITNSMRNVEKAMRNCLAWQESHQ